MSMFWCQRCDEMRDSDDGCVEGEAGKGSGLICADCMADMEDDEPVNAKHSYADIYETLTKAGCPEDIAHELAREKSRD